MGVKSLGLTGRGRSKLLGLGAGEGSGISSVAVICADMERTPVAKAASWPVTDAKMRKLGEQTGLDTPVVLAVNDGY